VVLGLPLLFLGAIYGASELGGEVVVLHRPGPDGSTSTVRIWIVEDGEGAWVEHGSADSPWMQRLADDASVTLERGGAAGVYRAVPDPGAHARYHELRQAKYTWADSFIAAATGTSSECAGVPVRLEAASG
jgi:hypothetical protein